MPGGHAQSINLRPVMESATLVVGNVPTTLLALAAVLVRHVDKTPPLELAHVPVSRTRGPVPANNRWLESQLLTHLNDACVGSAQQFL